MQRDQAVTSDVEVDANGNARLFDPFGLFLVGIVGGSGFLFLLHHNWVLGFPMAVLATLGLITSHRHFDRPREA